MIGPAASVASAAGLGWLAVELECFAVGLGCLLQRGLASGKAGWQLSADRGCLAADWAVLR